MTELTNTRTDHSPAWKVVHEKQDRHGIVYDRTEYLEVPGGRIYRTVISNTNGDEYEDDIVAMVFVPGKWL